MGFRSPPRFSLAALLAVVVLVAAALAVRQGLYMPIVRRAEIGRRLLAEGFTLESRPAGPSWRDWLFTPDELREVTSVRAVEGKLPPGILADLPRLTHLTTVRLRGCEVADADAVHLARIPRLAVLDLGNTRIGDAGLATLAKARLTDLDVAGTRVTGDSLPAIAGMTTLRRLVLPERIGRDRLAELAPLTGLTVLGQPGWTFIWEGTESSYLPAELGRLPLVSTATEWGSQAMFLGDSAFPEPWDDGLAPPIPPELLAAPLPPPPEPWGYLPNVTLTDPTQERWLALARRPRLERVAITGPVDGLDFGASGGPTIPELVFRINRLTPERLAKLLAIPTGDDLGIHADEFVVSPEPFVAAMLAARPRKSLRISAPVDFSVLLGVDGVAANCPVPNVVLYDTGLDEWGRGDGFHIRTDGKPWTPRTYRARRLEIDHPAPPPPDWETVALLARGDRIVIRFRSPEPKPLDVAAWRTWFSHPAVREIVTDDGPEITPDLLEAALTNRELTNLQIRGGFLDDAWLKRILALPKLEYLNILGDGLTDDAITIAEAHNAIADPEAEPGGDIVLGSLRFSPEAVARDRESVHVRAWLPYLQRPGDEGEKNRFKADMLVLTKSEIPTAERGRLLAERFPDVRVVRRAFRADAPPWEELAPLTAVRHLQLSETTAAVPLDGWAKSIPHLATLQSLGIDQVHWASGPDPAATDLAWLADAAALEFLAVDGVPVSEAGLARLATLPRLKDLRIGRLADRDRGRPSDTAFLANGQPWRSLVAVDLRITVDDLERLADRGTVRLLAVDGVLLDRRSVPALERLIDRGAHILLDRPDLDRATVERLAARAKSMNGSFQIGDNVVGKIDAIAPTPVPGGSLP